MLQRGKLLVFLCSTLVVLYGISAAFYGRVVARDEAYRELSVLIEVLKKVNDDYVEVPDVSKAQEGAMKGLLEALDPYSCYLSKEQNEVIEKRRAEGTASVGVVLSKRSQMLYVVATQRNGGAQEGGLRPGDYLVAVDGASVEDMSILEVESLFRGAPGSKVKVTVFRSYRPTKPVDIELTRKRDAPLAVGERMLEGNVGVLTVPSLAAGASDQARVRLRTLLSAGAQKIVLDLRDCADGDATDGVQLANLFLRSGMIYYSQNRAGDKVDEVKADPEKFITDVPLVVLINGSTAGPAEITAGALKDQKRAILVGEKSSGVGSSQRRFQLKNGAVLILSTAKFYTPAGKEIQSESVRNTGIKPDIQSPSDERRQDLFVESYYEEQDDAAKYKQIQEKVYKEQFDKAIEVLSKGKVLEKQAA